MAVESRALPFSGPLGRLGSHRQLLLNIAIVAFCSVGVKAAGMIRDVVLASEFGTSDAADAFIAAWAIPQFLAIIAGNAFAGVIIPLQAEARGRGGEAQSRRFLSEMLLLSIAGLAAITLLLVPFRDQLLPLVTANFGPAKLAETRELWMIMLPAVFLFAMATIWSAMLNTDDRFGLAALSPMLVPFSTIAALWIHPQGGITSPTVGFVIGSLLQVLWLLFGLRRNNLTILPVWHGGVAETRMALRQFVPYLANGVVFGGVGVVDQAMAATLGQGSLATLSYGNKLVLPVLAIGSAALATVVYPRFSRLVAEREWTRLQHQVKAYLTLTLLATVPATALIVFGSTVIVQLLFEHGEFNPADTAAVARLQTIFALMIPAYTLSQLLSRVLNAMRATRYLLIGSIVIFAFNITADYLFKEWFGITGIALATVGNYLLALAFNLYLFRRLITARLSAQGSP
ncbi:MAG TPA: lipid II flippase MurJ [Thermomicrobiales bacterium]|nr:lipid II flippase MurJ [Thermomicrobiales bacterium]